MPDQPRPVWLTLDEYALSNDALARLARQRWQAAPADPVNAAKHALADCYGLENTERQDVWEGAHAVLRALRIPEPTDA